jgi:hypothetical protein
MSQRNKFIMKKKNQQQAHKGRVQENTQLDT